MNGIFPGSRFPDSIRITSDGPEATGGAALLVAAIPTSFLRGTLGQLAAEIPLSVPVLSVVKGIEYGTFARPSQIILEIAGPATGRRAERAKSCGRAGPGASGLGRRLGNRRRAQRSDPRPAQP